MGLHMFHEHHSTVLGHCNVTKAEHWYADLVFICTMACAAVRAGLVGAL